MLCSAYLFFWILYMFQLPAEQGDLQVDFICQEKNDPVYDLLEKWKICLIEKISPAFHWAGITHTCLPQLCSCKDNNSLKSETIRNFATWNQISKNKTSLLSELSPFDMENQPQFTASELQSFRGKVAEHKIPHLP